MSANDVFNTASLDDFFDEAARSASGSAHAREQDTMDVFSTEVSLTVPISERAMTYGETDIMRKVFCGQIKSDDVWICKAERSGFLKQDTVVAVKGGRIYLFDDAYSDDLSRENVDAQALFVHALMFVLQNKQKTYTRENVREISRDWGKGLAKDVLSKSEEFDARDPRQQGAIMAFAFHAKEILSRHRDFVQATGIEDRLRKAHLFSLSQLPPSFERFQHAAGIATATGGKNWHNDELRPQS